MKKIIYFFFAAVLITGTLIAPVSALDSEDYYITCLPYIEVTDVNSNSSIVVEMDGTRQSRSNARLDYIHMPISSGQYTTQTFIVTTLRVVTSDIENIIPKSIYIDNEYFGELTYNSSIKRYSGKVSSFAEMYVTVQPSDSDTVTINVFINFRSGVPRLISLYFDNSNVDVDGLSFNWFTGTPSTCVSLSGATNQDIVDSNQAIVAAIEAMSSSSGTSSNAIVQALLETGASITTNASTNATQISASVDQVKQAVEIMEENMSGNVSDGMKDFSEYEEEKVVSEGNEAANEILDKIPLLDELDSVINIFVHLGEVLANSSMEPELTIPPGRVSILGTDYVFWEEFIIDFSHYFSLPVFSTLLTAFRFIFYLGFVYQIYFYIRKIISIVLMEY